MALNGSEDNEWYLAEIVELVTVADENETSVYNNLVLIRAHSAEDAYRKAVARGKEREERYEDEDGKAVTVSFRGLSDLNLIGNELEDGTEIIYEELVGLSPQNLADMIPPKEQLGVFRPEEL